MRTEVDEVELMKAAKLAARIGAAEAGRQMDIRPARIRNFAKKVGIELKRIMPRKISEKQAIEFAMAYGVRKAAQLLGVSQNNVWRYLNSNNITPPKIYYDQGKAKDFDLELAVMCFLFPGQPQTLDEIGSFCGISKERVRQLEASALKKIRKKLLEKGLKGEFFLAGKRIGE